VTASDPMPDTVLVIGGSGRTGRLVVRRLLQEERLVRVMSRRPAADDPRVEAVRGSITDADACGDPRLRRRCGQCRAAG
jgi:nucleoside-diphosphate-sugar epimerase